MTNSLKKTLLKPTKWQPKKAIKNISNTTKQITEDRGIHYHQRP